MPMVRAIKKPGLRQVSWLLATTVFPTFPALLFGPVAPHLAGRDGSPVTVAGPRRSFTGFPFQPQFIWATFRLSSIVNAVILSYLPTGFNYPAADSPLSAGLSWPTDKHDAFPAHILVAHLFKRLKSIRLELGALEICIQVRIREITAYHRLFLGIGEPHIVRDQVPVTIGLHELDAGDFCRGPSGSASCRPPW